MTVRYYDRNGQAMTLMSWARAWENMEYRVLASTNIDGYWVSTIWIGIDMDIANFIRKIPAPPMIFESVIFVVPEGDDNWKSLEMRRYRTEKDAMVGHTELVHIVNTMVDVDKEVVSNDGSDSPAVRPEGDA